MMKIYIDMRDFAASDNDTNSAAKAERQRVAAILESPEGERQPELAFELALRTTLDADSAKAVLARVPAECSLHIQTLLTTKELAGKLAALNS